MEIKTVGVSLRSRWLSIEAVRNPVFGTAQVCLQRLWLQ